MYTDFQSYLQTTLKEIEEDPLADLFAPAPKAEEKKPERPRQERKPKPAPASIEERTPLEAAVNIATDFYTRGLWERSHYVSGGAADGNWSYYAEQCRVLSKALKELGESESYRVGLFVTAIPRGIKRWLDRKKRNKK